MNLSHPSPLSVAYRPGPATVQPGTLAVFAFGGPRQPRPDPRQVDVPLQRLDADTPCEYWSVDADVERGGGEELRWAAGGGWRLVVVEVDEASHGGIVSASEHAYRLLLGHVGSSPEPHLQRIWNYLAAINDGEGDAERYRLFCSGRARGLAAHAVTRYPAATAIGHHGAPGLLQVYALCTSAPGAAIENPRQVSAWQYPRQYGPSAPNFARAMKLYNGALAISGTAAVIGHASHHQDDLAAQVDEAFANLQALLDRAGLPDFDAHSPLKIYVRNPDDAEGVRAALGRHLDASVPRVLLRGDICRRELLVEIDGWRFGGEG